MTKAIPRRVSSKPVDLRALVEQKGPEALAAFDSKLAVLQAARLVREARASVGLSQQELAERADTTQSAISDIERGAGSQGPTISVLARIVQACNSRLQLEATRPTSHSPRSLDAAFLDLKTIVAQYDEREIGGTEILRVVRQSPFDMIDIVHPIETFGWHSARFVQVEQVSGANTTGFRVTVIDEETSSEVSVAVE